MSRLAVDAADAAIADAQFDVRSISPTRIGVSVGTCMGGIISTESAYDQLFRNDADRVSPFTLVKTMYNAPAAHIALKHGFIGPALTYTTTCSSSSVAIGEAMRQIRHGYSDVMIAGGAEALLIWGSVKAWLALQIIAPLREERPSASCRPFSKDRSGTVIGEGSAFVVLEELSQAESRGAHIYAELAGYGVVNDSAHLTQPTTEGQAQAMRNALLDANVRPEHIQYINAHGTGTQLNDVVETRAIRQTFGVHADSISVSSTKSMHGHLVGAAGALELAICAMAIERQAVPPTAHLDYADPECDLDYVAHKGRRREVLATLSNSFAFGGVGATLVLTSPD